MKSQSLFNALEFEIIVLSIITLFCSCSDNINTPQENPLEVNFSVEYYEIFYDFDVKVNQFRSDQKVSITPIQTTSKLIFEILSDLEINNLSLEESNGDVIKIQSWECIEKIQHNRGDQKDIFSRIEVSLVDKVFANSSLDLSISYSYKISQDNSSDVPELLKFHMGPDGGRALHPISGTVPYFGGVVAAPFKVKFRHSADYICSVPGSIKYIEQEDDDVIELFESSIAAIPVFYLGKGRSVKRHYNGITIEFNLTEGQDFEEEVADKTIEIVNLLTSNFGNTENTDFRFSFVALPSSSITGESKGNSIYFAYRNPSEYQWDDKSKESFLSLIAHELFHNWNLWKLQWQGSYYEWFVEGGAGFASSWLCEKILGRESGANIRKGFVNGYTENKGYNARRTLSSATKSTKEERSLIYSYGALVWAQLNKRMGDSSFISALSSFIKNNSTSVGYHDFVDAFKKQSEFDMKSFLEQWCNENAKIDLKINSVSTLPSNGIFVTEVILEVDAEQDYQIFTSLGFKSSYQDHLDTIDLVLDKKGVHTITFNSQHPPANIVIDPDVVIPQINFENNLWLK